MNGITELAAFLGAQPFDSTAIDEKLRLHVADTVGAWVAATATAEGKALIRFQRPLQGGAANVLDDVALHCALARLSEVDDIHLASMTTPGAIVIPTALLLAARFDASDDLAAAIVGGCEAMVRLGRAIRGPEVLYRGIWPTYFAAAFGTAAVAARLLGLSEQQAAHALALALSLSAPSVGQHHAVSTARWLAVGHAARNGLTAAFAARAGFTADLDLMRSRFLPDIYGITPDLAAMTEGLGERIALAEVSFKPWCAARQTMAATQALREFADSGITPDQITAITAAVLPPHLKMVNHGVTAGDRASYITSLPYQMAVAVLQGETDLDLNPPMGMPSQVLQSFMARVTVIADDGLLAHYPSEWPARVTLTTSQGQIEKLVRQIPGDPGRPLNEVGIKTKFQRLVAPVLHRSTDQLWQSASNSLRSAEALAQLVQELEQIAG